MCGYGSCTFCGRCGKALPRVAIGVCPFCKEKLDDESEACPKCGAAVPRSPGTLSPNAEPSKPLSSDEGEGLSADNEKEK